MWSIHEHIQMNMNENERIDTSLCGQQNAGILIRDVNGCA